MSPRKDAGQAKRKGPLVAVIMGSASDQEKIAPLFDALREFDLSHEQAVLSAHRAPEALARYLAAAPERGIELIIAAAGGAAHLPGVVASQTVLPVIGIPVLTSAFQGIDSLLSIIQMPKGVPVATMAVGAAGAYNAGVFGARLLALAHPELAPRLRKYRKALAASARAPKKA